MPSVKVCLWNIQNYGSGAVNARWGANSALRNRFIAAFVVQQQIDVLMIMEVSRKAEPSLHDLAVQLNANPVGGVADWVVSFCGSAITNLAANPPTLPAHLMFLTDARSEGYAVAWRSNQPARFRMLDGLHPIAQNTFPQPAAPAPPVSSPLNLSTFGRPAGALPVMAGRGAQRRAVPGPWEVFGGYTQPNAFPYNKGVLMNVWPDLELPATSTTNPRQLSLRKVRRPAYVVLDIVRPGVAPPARTRLCPVAVYHAPSRLAGAEWGTAQSALSRELYVTNDLGANNQPNPAALVTVDHSVFGGDFNYSVQNAQWPSEYAWFVNALGVPAAAGAGHHAAPVPPEAEAARRTTVRLFEDDHKTPIEGEEIDDYLKLKIDLAFFTDPAKDEGERINLPDVLMQAPAVGVYTPALQALHAHLTALVAGLVAPNQRLSPIHGPEYLKRTRKRGGNWVEKWVPMLPGSWGSTFLNWPLFMEQLEQGKIQHARQAAELFHLFISDHLPVVVELEN